MCPINTLVVKSHLYIGVPRANSSNILPVTVAYVNGQHSTIKSRKIANCKQETKVCLFDMHASGLACVVPTCHFKLRAHSGNFCC